MTCTSHKKLIGFFSIIILLVVVIPAITFTARAWTPTTIVFDWDTAATDNGSAVSETIDGVTATVSSDTGIDLSSLSGYGTTANCAVSASGATSVTITFSEAVDIISITALNTGSEAANWAFTPTGVSTNAVFSAVDNTAASTVYVNWAEVTSFTVTSDNVNSIFGFDDIVTDTEDVTQPYLVSATRSSDTQIVVELSEDCQNLSKSNDGGFTVTKTGSTDTYAVIAIAQGTDANQVILTVDDMSAAQSTGVTVTYTLGGNGTILDIAGNALATDATGVTINAWDTTPPTLVSAAYNSDTQITVTLSEECTGLDNTNNNGGFVVTQTGTTVAYAVVSTAEGTDASQVVLTVANMAVAGPDGVTVTYSTDNNGSVADSAGNEMQSDAAGVSVAGWNAAPYVVSILRDSPSAERILPQNLISYRVIFSENVRSISIDDFTLTTTGTASATSSGMYIRNSAGHYIVYYYDAAGEGELRLDVKDDAGIFDSSGVPLASGYTEGASFYVDSTAPTLESVEYTSDTQLTVTLSEECLELDKSSSNGFTVFNTITQKIYSVTQTQQGADATQIILTVSGLANAYGAGVTVVYTPLTTATITDLVGHAMEADSTGVSVPAWGEWTDFPTVTSIVRYSPTSETIGKTSMASFRISFSEPMRNVETSNMQLVKTGTASASFIGLITCSSDRKTYTIYIENIEGEGTVTLVIPDNSGITNLHGAPLAAGFAEGQSYTVDSVAPTIQSAAYTSDTQITITLSEECQGLANASNNGGFTVTKTGSADTYTVNSTQEGTTSHTIILNVDDISAAGTAGVTVTYNASNNGSVSDLMGNSMKTDDTGVAIDAWLLPPTVEGITRQAPASETTNATSITYRVTFSETVTGLDTADFTLTKTGSIAGTVASVSMISGSEYDVTVNSISGDGTLRLDIKPSGTGIMDTDSMAIEGGYTNGQTYTIDTSAPTILSAVRDSDTQITVTMSENCPLAAQSSDGGFTVTKTGDGTAYTVSKISQTADQSQIVLTVSDISSAGAAGVTVVYTAGGNGTVQDATGNALATDSTGVSITAWDTDAPTVLSINRQNPVAATTNAASIIWRVTFSEAVTGVDATDFRLTKTGTADGTIASVSSISGASIDVTVHAVSGDGTLRLDFNNSGSDITDIGGTAIASSYFNGQAYTLDTSAPTILSAVRDSDTQITVTMSEDCRNTSNNHCGGFTVTKTGTNETFQVLSTAPGSIILTVEDMSSARGTGVTVTYAAGGFGVITDTAGNSLASDAQGTTVTAWYTANPKTGDASHLALWLFLLTVSGLAVLVISAIPWRKRMRG